MSWHDVFIVVMTIIVAALFIGTAIFLLNKMAADTAQYCLTHVCINMTAV